MDTADCMPLAHHHSSTEERHQLGAPQHLVFYLTHSSVGHPLDPRGWYVAAYGGDAKGAHIVGRDRVCCSLDLLRGGEVVGEEERRRTWGALALRSCNRGSVVLLYPGAQV